MSNMNLSSGVVNQQLLKAAVKFNSITLGLVSGCLGAILIFVVTRISVNKWGENAGDYLDLLGVFLPGYSATSTGAWIGAFWAFIFAGLAGFLTYWLYGRLLGEKLASDADKLETTVDPIFKPVILRLYGSPLGVAIGLAVSTSLLISTLWLVVRGTAGESKHAELLANYLPGYSPSVIGGVIGTVELFCFVYIGCLILAFVYNKVVDIRHGKTK